MGSMEEKSAIWKEKEARLIIQEALRVTENEILDVEVLHKGMTNRSFLFTCRGKRYIMRVPGEGTDRLIDRKQEYAVYQTLSGKDICDTVLYMDPDNGFRITEYYDHARVCDPLNTNDVRQCMKKLRSFHELRLKVPHTFDLFGQMEYYESLWGGVASVYPDYAETKAAVLSLRPYIEAHVGETVLSHIDAVPDNFLFYEDRNGKPAIRLIDWEYAGMQDPHVDIAMFCVYALYDREQIDTLIDLYFTEGCQRTDRIKIYCYIAVCGLLWSNWCEYKKLFDIDFGEYAVGQYHFAQEYCKIAREEMEKEA